jgi:hypothetical protein
MVLPAMQKVHEKVNFTLSFIGTYVTRPLSYPTPLTPFRPTDQDDGVDCKHGPEECRFIMSFTARAGN